MALETGKTDPAGIYFTHGFLGDFEGWVVAAGKARPLSIRLFRRIRG